MDKKIKIKLVAEYTISEIMEDYKELWDRVVKYEEKLMCLQKSVVATLPFSKKRVADSTESLQRYLQEKSVYLFAHNVWKALYEICDKLTDFPYRSLDASEWEDNLNTYLGKLDDIDFEGLIPGSNVDLDEFYKSISSVVHDIVGVVKKWSLMDILGTGDKYPQLLDDTKNDVIPEDLSVGRIESDNTMKRID